MPEPVCCSCGGFPLVRFAPPLCAACDPTLEREAADLWAWFNPEQSVFNCDEKTKAHYRTMAIRERRRSA